MERDKGVVWLDKGKLVSFCSCCKKHHADADSDPAINALMEALELISDAQWDGEDSMCPWCRCDKHAADCKAALLLRRCGCKVLFVGERG